MPYEVHPSEPLSIFFETFREESGVIDYVLIGDLLPEEYADPYAFHKAAAGFTIEAASLRSPWSAEKGPSSRREPEKAQGEHITSADFFAPGYRGIPLELDPMLTPEEMEVERLKLDQEVFSHGERGQWMGNYEYAFLYPPYNRYNPDREGRERLFQAINQELFGNDEQALMIYQWSTDWADYFNDGQL